MYLEIKLYHGRKARYSKQSVKKLNESVQAPKRRVRMVIKARTDLLCSRNATCMQARSQVRSHPFPMAS